MQKEVGFKFEEKRSLGFLGMSLYVDDMVILVVKFVVNFRISVLSTFNTRYC